MTASRGEAWQDAYAVSSWRGTACVGPLGVALGVTALSAPSRSSPSSCSLGSA